MTDVGTYIYQNLLTKTQKMCVNKGISMSTSFQNLFNDLDANNDASAILEDISLITGAMSVLQSKKCQTAFGN